MCDDITTTVTLYCTEIAFIMPHSSVAFNILNEITISCSELEQTRHLLNIGRWS